MRRWAWALVAGVTLAVWAPVLSYDWLYTWDDAAMFVGNPSVRAWSWEWMARTQYQGHWMPLTWLSARLNHALFGYNAAAWHGVNIGLHAASAVLLFFIAKRLIGSTWGAVFAALLFSVHPLRMESVAWISERKDVLMGVFFLGATLLWMQGRRWWSFAAFVAACMAKSPAVMLPVWLLALDWYRVEPIKGEFTTPWRFWRTLLTPLIPFFAVAVIVSVMAFRSLHTILIELPWSAVPLGPRLLHVAYSEVFYVMQTVWPARLSGLIEYTWAPSWNQPQYPIAVAIVGSALALLVWTRRRWPALAAASVGYAVAVLPQAGLFQNGPQLVANRYSYLACLPLALLAGGAFTMVLRRLPRISFACAWATVAALAAVTILNLPMWRNSDAMWQYAALHEPTCTQCQDMATAADMRHSDFAGALEKQQRAIAVSDTTAVPHWERHWNLAVILVQLGRRDEAVAELRTYLALVPPDRYETVADKGHIESARRALAQLETKGAL